nr:sorting nexin-24 isoform X1 [Oryctolagus cuniculus]
MSSPVHTPPHCHGATPPFFTAEYYSAERGAHAVVSTHPDAELRHGRSQRCGTGAGAANPGASAGLLRKAGLPQAAAAASDSGLQAPPPAAPGPAPARPGAARGALRRADPAAAARSLGPRGRRSGRRGGRAGGGAAAAAAESQPGPARRRPAGWLGHGGLHPVLSLRGERPGAGLHDDYSGWSWCRPTSETLSRSPTWVLRAHVLEASSADSQPHQQEAGWEAEQVFKIEVLMNGRKHFVEKRYSEFHALHKKLKKCIKTPEIPSKHVRNWVPKVLEQRRQGLEMYLQAVILENEELPKLLLDFLNVRHLPSLPKAESCGSFDETESEESSKLSHQPVLLFLRDPYVLPAASDFPNVVIEGVLHGIFYPHLQPR